MCIKLAGVVKFASADIGKLKASLTTGNISQLLMRLVTKAEFIERRSMQYFAHQHDFERQFYEDFVDIDWQDKECGEQSMLAQIKKFIARKFAAGMIEIDNDDLEQFHDKIKKMLEDKAAEWGQEADRQHNWKLTDKARKNEEFFRKMATTLRAKFEAMKITDSSSFIWKVREAPGEIHYAIRRLKNTCP